MTSSDHESQLVRFIIILLRLVCLLEAEDNDKDFVIVIC